MDFFGIGGGEILLVLIIALIIWGPGRIVEFSRSLGQMLYSLRKAGSNLTTQITKELEEEKDHRDKPEKKVDDGAQDSGH